MYRGLHILLDWADSYKTEDPDWPLTLAASRALLLGYGKHANIPTKIITWASGRKKYEKGANALLREDNPDRGSQNFLSRLVMAIDNGATDFPPQMYARLSTSCHKLAEIGCLSRRRPDDHLVLQELERLIHYMNHVMMKLVYHGGDPYVLLYGILTPNSTVDLVPGIYSTPMWVLRRLAIFLVDLICPDGVDKYHPRISSIFGIKRIILNGGLLSFVFSLVDYGISSLVDGILHYIFSQKKPRLDQCGNRGNVFHKFAHLGPKGMIYLVSKINIQQQHQETSHPHNNIAMVPSVTTQINHIANTLEWELMITQETMTKLLSELNDEKLCPLDTYVECNRQRGYDNKLDWDIVIQFLLWRSDGLPEELGPYLSFNFLYYMARVPLTEPQKAQLRRIPETFSMYLNLKVLHDNNIYIISSVLNNSHPENLCFFLELGADPFFRGEGGDNFLHSIAKRGGMEQQVWRQLIRDDRVRSFVQRVLRQPDHFGVLPIARWKFKHAYSLKSLISILELYNNYNRSGFGGNGQCIRDEYGDTLCHALVSCENVHIYEHEIKESKIDVTINTPNKKGDTPLLHLCGRWKQLQEFSTGSLKKKVNFLLKLGADPTWTNKRSGETLAHLAIRHHTPSHALAILQVLVREQRESLVKILSIKDDTGALPLDLAERQMAGKKNPTNPMKALVEICKTYM